MKFPIVLPVQIKRYDPLEVKMMTAPDPETYQQLRSQFDLMQRDREQGESSPLTHSHTLFLSPF